MPIHAPSKPLLDLIPSGAFDRQSRFIPKLLVQLLPHSVIVLRFWPLGVPVAESLLVPFNTSPPLEEAAGECRLTPRNSCGVGWGRNCPDGLMRALCGWRNKHQPMGGK